MNMPRFTAESSMYEASNTYRGASGILQGNASTLIMPQLFCEWACLVHGCVPFCQTHRRATGGDFAACAAECALLTPLIMCPILCSEGGGGGRGPGGPGFGAGPRGSGEGGVTEPPIRQQ